jgi:hypothetical protein
MTQPTAKDVSANYYTRSSEPEYISDVLLLCVECHGPIKARINTSSWIRVEWIGPQGECQGCYNQKKEAANANRLS